MVARGYRGGGSAETARPPRRLPSATYRPAPGPPGSGTDAISTTNRRGEWVPAIPLPLYARGRKWCHCGEGFWTARGYRGHYALVHVLGQD